MPDPSTDAARLSLFLGKGGVGKTTVAVAYAVDRARAGERVLLTSLVSPDEVEALLRDEARPTPSSDAEGAGEGEGPDLELQGNLDFLQLDPRGLVDDIVRRITRLGVMAEFVVNHPGYASLLDIVPGIRELAVLNLLVNKAEGRYVDGEPYDRIVLDGAATGHGLSFLEAPRKSAPILTGKLRERARELDRFLQNPECTEAVIVTLPEEMPVRETEQLARGLRDSGVHVDNVVVNRWLPAVFAHEGADAILTQLEGTPELREDLARDLDPEDGDAGGADAWVDALGHIRSRRRENIEHIRRLQGIETKLHLVPLLPERRGRLLRVAEALHEAVDLEEALAGKEVLP